MIRQWFTLWLMRYPPNTALIVHIMNRLDAIEDNPGLINAWRQIELLDAKLEAADARIMTCEADNMDLHQRLDNRQQQPIASAEVRPFLRVVTDKPRE